MKQQEILKLSDSDLLEEIEKQTAAYGDLKRTHTVSPLENPMQLKELRKSIARLKTELTKRNTLI